MALAVPSAHVRTGTEVTDMSDAALATTTADATVSFAIPRRALGALRGWHVYLALGLAAIGAYYRLPKAGWGQCILLTTLNATAALVAARAAWRGRGWSRVLWISLGFAMLLSAVGNGPYFGYPLVTGRILPFPSPVDAVLLAAFPFFALALVALTRIHRGARRRGRLLDAGILVIGGGLVLWEQMVVPTAAFPLPKFALQVSVAYPVLDVVLFALLAWFLAVASGRNAATGWLVASYVILLAGAAEFSAQVGAGTYAYGGPTDALWMLSYLLVGVAALHPASITAPRPAGAPRRATAVVRFVVVTGALLVGPVMLVVGTHQGTLVGYATALAAVFAVARVLRSVRRPAPALAY